MAGLTQIALLLSLGGVVWQDFKDRWISVALFGCIGIIAIGMLLMKTTIVTADDVILNLCFITLCFGGLAFYHKVRYGAFLDFVDEGFGKGDIVFLVLLTCLLPFTSYLLFFIASTCIILFGSFLFQQLSKQEDLKIPLAGGQALLLMVHFALMWWMDIDLLSSFQLI